MGATVRIDNNHHRKNLVDFVGQVGRVVATAHDGQAFRLIVMIGQKLIEVGTWEVEVLAMQVDVVVTGTAGAS